jgi:hypothetical protein
VAAPKERPTAGAVPGNPRVSRKSVPEGLSPHVKQGKATKESEFDSVSLDGLQHVARQSLNLPIIPYERHIQDHRPLHLDQTSKQTLAFTCPFLFVAASTLHSVVQSGLHISGSTTIVHEEFEPELLVVTVLLSKSRDKFTSLTRGEARSVTLLAIQSLRLLFRGSCFYSILVLT